MAGVNALLPVLCGTVAAAASGFNPFRLSRAARRHEARMERIFEPARSLVAAG